MKRKHELFGRDSSGLRDYSPKERTQIQTELWQARAVECRLTALTCEIQVDKRRSFMSGFILLAVLRFSVNAKNEPQTCKACAFLIQSLVRTGVVKPPDTLIDSATSSVWFMDRGDEHFCLDSPLFHIAILLSV